MLSTSSRSIGNNWAADKELFGTVHLGVGPLNLRVGTNHILGNMLNIEDNWGTVISNAVGFSGWALNETFSDGKAGVTWDWNSLSPVWDDKGGWVDELWPNPTGAYTQLATSDFYNLHEGVHVTQSRFWGHTLWGTGWLPLYFYNHLWPVSYGSDVWRWNWFEMQAYGHGWR